MSVFYSDPPAPAQPNQAKKDIPLPIAIVMFVMFIGLFAMVTVYKRIPSEDELYFQFYKAIYFGEYLVAALFSGCAIYAIYKRTQKMTDRALLLSQAKDGRGTIRVGNTLDGVTLHLTEKERCGHVQLLGATGRGKTESVIVPWMARDILSGRNAILIDGKGDPDILDKILQAGNRTNAEIHVFDLGNPDLGCATNPLENGSAQQITDRIFTAFTFDDTYYKSVQSDITGSVIQLIKNLGDVVRFKGIYKLLTDDGELTQAVARCHDDEIKKKVARHLSIPKASRDEKLSGLLSQLAPFAVGEVAELVNGPTEKRQCCKVSDLLFRGSDGKQHVLIMLIPTLKYQQIGHQLGRLLLQELGWAIGERASRKGTLSNFLPVYLDEFSAFVYPGFTNILNKARSSRVALHLSHQSQGDLAQVSKEVAEIVVTNTNVKCILGLNDPQSADFMARHIGTRTEEKLTEQAEDFGFLSKREKTGRMSVREVEAYKIHPNLLKNFMNGRGVLHLPTPLGNISEEIQFEPISDKELYAGVVDVAGAH